MFLLIMLSSLDFPSVSSKRPKTRRRRLLAGRRGPLSNRLRRIEASVMSLQLELINAQRQNQRMLAEQDARYGELAEKITNVTTLKIESGQVFASYSPENQAASVTFKSPFIKPPTVVLSLSEFELQPEDLYAIQTASDEYEYGMLVPASWQFQVQNKTSTGFDLNFDIHVDRNGTRGFHHCRYTWIAYGHTLLLDERL